MTWFWHMRLPPAVILLWSVVAVSSYSVRPHALCPFEICSECTIERAVCESTSLEEPIPQNLTETIRFLNISRQHTSGGPITLTRRMFRRYDMLRILRIHGHFHFIEEGAFDDLIDLRRLNIINTNITYLPDNLLRNNVLIQAVSFNGNRFLSIPFNVLGKTNNLTRFRFNGNWFQVTLPCNNISVTLPSVISNFDSLAVLSLRGLQLNTSSCSSSTIPSNFFQPLSKSLISLDLSETNLLLPNQTTLSSLRNLKNLTLTAVLPFRNCPSQAMEFLKKLPRSLELLNLMHWENVGSLNNSCFLNNSNLGGLEELPALANLSFRNSDYAFSSSLGAQSLPRLISLKILDLGFCRIASLSPHSLSNAPNLTVLNLDGNPLGYRIYSYNSDNPPLHHLSVDTLSIQRANIRSDNIIKFNLEPVTRFFDNIRKIDFTGNYLSELPAFEPEDHSSDAEPTSLGITELIMDNNELTAFSKVYPNDNFCTNFPTIKSISLAHNSLESIEGLCPGLVYLNLDYNKLEGEEKSTFAIIKNQTDLEVLSISENYIQLRSDLLFDMLNLTIFRAADNQINEIPKYFFANNSVLKEIDLSFNYISSVSREMFEGLHQLEILLLQGNAISTFDEHFTGFIESAQSLREFDLRNNPIECACDLDYFKDWLANTTKVPNVKRLLCSGPKELANSLVFNYVVNHFECFVKIPLIHTVFAILGFICTLVFAIPCYKYRWYLRHLKVVYRAIRDSLRNVRLEHKCEYDAYVSYDRESQQDAKWVEKSLIPAIEQSRDGHLQHPSQRPKLYVDERNAPIGIPRFTERAEALRKSRKILIIASNSYLSSAYCLGEADLAGYEMYGTEFYQPNRIMVLVREELCEEIIRAPMTALLVGNVINVDCTGKKQVNMWRRIQNFVKMPQYLYRKPDPAGKARQFVGRKRKSVANGRSELEME